MKLSNLIGSKVFSIYEGEMIGYILNYQLSKNKKFITSLISVNDYDEYYYTFAPKDIKIITSGAVFLKNNSILTIIDNNITTNNPVFNKQAYNTKGDYLGILNDAELTNKLEIKNYMTSLNFLINHKQIINSGKDFCLINTGEKFFNLNYYAPDENYKQNQNLDKINVSIMTLGQVENTAINNQVTKPHITLPLKINQNYSERIINTIAHNTIVGKNSELIIRRGQIITREIYEKAKQHGVLGSFF